MSDRQVQMLRNVLSELIRGAGHRPIHFHHGCCHGADMQAHFYASSIGLYVVGHPSSDQQQRAIRRAGGCDQLRSIQPPLARNRVMVAECSIVIAAPAQGVEVLRSGTWATVRYAREAKRLRYMLLPDQRTYMVVRPGA